MQSFLEIRPICDSNMQVIIIITHIRRAREQQSTHSERAWPVQQNN